MKEVEDRRKIPLGNFRTRKYNNQNKNSLNGLNSRMTVREGKKKSVNLKVKQ